MGQNVKKLVEQLLDAKIEAEEFPRKLYVELKSSPQLHLVSFLKKSVVAYDNFCITPRAASSNVLADFYNGTQNCVSANFEPTWWSRGSQSWTCDTSFSGPSCCNKGNNSWNCFASDFKTTCDICTKQWQQSHCNLKSQLSLEHLLLALQFKSNLPSRTPSFTTAGIPQVVQVKQPGVVQQPSGGNEKQVTKLSHFSALTIQKSGQKMMPGNTVIPTSQFPPASTLKQITLPGNKILSLQASPTQKNKIKENGTT
ncbi:Transcription initiation factor TFIID subunit 4B [Plecturocebus cupreus]